MNKVTKELKLTQNSVEEKVEGVEERADRVEKLYNIIDEKVKEKFGN